MNADQIARAIRDVLKDERGEWRELQSCADAVQDISIIINQYDPPRVRRIEPPALLADASAQATNARAAVRLLQAALLHAKDAPRTAARIRAALSSARGAVRNAEQRRWRMGAAS